MNYSPNTTDAMTDTLAEAAEAILEMLGDVDAYALEIGAHVAKALWGASPRAARSTIDTLASWLGVAPRELVRCHEAHVVSRLAGEGLAARLPLGGPLDLFAQLSRIARADGSMGWRQDAILRVAREYGCGMPLHEVSGLVDATLAGRQRRARASRIQWSRGPALGLAREVEAAVAGPKAA